MEDKFNINVLGTIYTVERKAYTECMEFEKYGWGGYCDEAIKSIVIGKMDTYPDMENEDKKVYENIEKQNLRHEIIHAFFNESGLSASSSQFCGAWAKNEEMVDWFAIQSPKMFKLFKQLKLL